MCSGAGLRETRAYGRWTGKGTRTRYQKGNGKRNSQSSASRIKHGRPLSQAQASARLGQRWYRRNG
ncbi:hypothetical protein BDV24DRAFT_139097 [Aspergillus arachidicola]|uniref:Uncharacterized protein n=1 Tax=Aspergillus arachidicola TaxID=656916 RepID=A0A5N6XXM8_9EURO|nr:hypothetical protein BDV24DRAFT_139097 [Aspergillus arachidicola]